MFFTNVTRWSWGAGAIIVAVCIDGWAATVSLPVALTFSLSRSTFNCLHILSLILQIDWKTKNTQTGCRTPYIKTRWIINTNKKKLACLLFLCAQSVDRFRFYCTNRGRNYNKWKSKDCQVKWLVSIHCSCAISQPIRTYFTRLLICTNVYDFTLGVVLCTHLDIYSF